MQVITLSQDDLVDILNELNHARENRLRVRVAIEDGVKIAIGGGAWTLPYGRDTTGRS